MIREFYFDDKGVGNFCGCDNYNVGVYNFNYKCFNGLIELYKDIWLLFVGEV